MGVARLPRGRLPDNSSRSGRITSAAGAGLISICTLNLDIVPDSLTAEKVEQIMSGRPVSRASSPKSKGGKKPKAKGRKKPPTTLELPEGGV